MEQEKAIRLGKRGDVALAREADSKDGRRYKARSKQFN
jgi:hypothetical protein